MKSFKHLWLAFLSGCLMVSVGSSAMAAGPKANKLRSTDWSYQGETGPSNWAALSEKNETCASGAYQSPIDIGQVQPAKLPRIAFHYRSNSLSITHTGHTVESEYESGSYLRLGGVRYDLKRLHFHSPSEHTLLGRRSALEAHLEHEGPKGEQLVVAVLMHPGKRPNSMLNRIAANLPTAEGKSYKDRRSGVNPTFLLPASRRYFSYTGSLTTPPCTEGVRWIVFTESMEVPARDIRRFKAVLGQNARPVQALNKHRVFVKR